MPQIKNFQIPTFWRTSWAPQVALFQNTAYQKMFLELKNLRALYVKLPNLKNPSGTYPFRPLYFRPFPQISKFSSLLRYSNKLLTIFLAYNPLNFNPIYFELFNFYWLEKNQF